MGEKARKMFGVWMTIVLLSIASAACAQYQVQAAPGQPQVQINVTVGSVVQEMPESSGRIDWTKGVVEAMGSGAPPTGRDYSDAQRRLMARRAAVVEAQRNLAETINGVKLTSYSVVRNFVLEDDTIRSTMEAFVHGSRVVSERQLPDGSYEVVVRIGMYGPSSVSAATLPAAVQQERKMRQQGTMPPPVITIPAQPLPPAIQVPGPEAVAPPGTGTPAPGGQDMTPPVPQPSGVPGVDHFTGLVIDCRGLDLSPAMSPKVLDKSGREIWGTMQIDPEIAIEYGIVGYYRSVDEARRSPRAAQNPLVVKAIGKAGRAKMFQADAVVTVEDGQRILNENARGKFLEKLNVCFVVD